MLAKGSNGTAQSNGTGSQMAVMAIAGSIGLLSLGALVHIVRMGQTNCRLKHASIDSTNLLFMRPCQ